MPYEHRLLLAMNRGHEPSADRLWALFAPRLLAYAAAVLPRDLRDAADDVVQQVFCSVLDRPRRKLKGVGDVTAWLFRVTRNAALNHARGELREQDRRAKSGCGIGPGEGLGSGGDLRDDADRLRAATGSLPDEQREVILLRHIGGLTLDQAAISLGMNRNTLASRYRAGVRAMRTWMERDSKEGREAGYARP